MSVSSDNKNMLGNSDHKGGVGHWKIQRITSVILVPLSLLFLYTFMTTMGAGHSAMVQTYSQPWNAIVAVLFMALMFYHLALGLEVVIDDYIPNPKQHKVAMTLAKLFCGILPIIAVVSVLKILFSA